MAEPVAVSCPDCGTKMKVRADTLGKKIRCKECDEVFVAREAGVKPGKSAIAARPTGKSGPQARPASKPEAKAKPEASAPASSSLPFKKDDDEDDSGNPYGLGEFSTSARCPECANEMESEDAVVCLKCGYNTRTRLRAGTRRTVDQTQGDYFLWWLPGIACLLGAVFLLTGDILFCVNINAWVKGNDDLDWLGHYFFKFWGTLVNLFIIYFMGRFAVQRLIIDSKPPEIEIKK